MDIADPAAYAASMQALIEAYRSTTYTNYGAMVGFALVVSDHLHTLPREVQYMWPAKLSLPKVLFFILRYLKIVNSIFFLIYILPRDAAPELCRSRFYLAGLSSTVLVLCAEAILCLRVYAFSGCSRGLLAYLAVQFCAMQATGYFVLTVQFIRSVEYKPIPFRNASCFPVQANATLLGKVFGLLFAGVLISMILMVILAYRQYQVGLSAGGFKNSLFTVFYRDGIFYFISLSAILSASIIVTFTAPRKYNQHFMQSGIAVDIYTILSARMLLHLRQWAQRDGLQNPRVGTFATRTMDGIDYSAMHRPLTPILFQDRGVTAPVDTNSSSAAARSTMEV